MSIYSKNTSIHKYTTQRIHSIQNCLIQHAYTKKFILNMFQRKSTHQELQKNTSSCPTQGKATRTTQPEEGKRRVMSNAITQ